MAVKKVPYPTLEEVEDAGHEQLARWHRFLESPGFSALTSPPDDATFREVQAKETAIAMRIEERLTALGGITPELSKKIGWEPE